MDHRFCMFCHHLRMYVDRCTLERTSSRREGHIGIGASSGDNGESVDCARVCDSLGFETVFGFFGNL